MKKLSLIRIVQVGLIIAIMFAFNVTTVVKAASETYFFVTKWGTYGPSVFNARALEFL
jgi:hypothetical protein